VNPQSDPQRAITEWLCQPAGALVEQRRSPSGWISRLRIGGGAEADRSTIRFLKALRSGQSELHAVAFRTIEGHKRACIVGVKKDSGREWGIVGMAGGSGSDPPRDRPWVNFGAWGWPNHGFSGGGRLTGARHEETDLVRLKFRNGVELRDTVGDGVVLFMTEVAAEVPISVEILNASGQLLNRYSWP